MLARFSVSSDQFALLFGYETVRSLDNLVVLLF